MSRLRWRTAYALNRLPGLCWANLVSWALGSAPLRETPIDSVCRYDIARTGTCYCGKLRTPGGNALTPDKGTADH